MGATDQALATTIATGPVPAMGMATAMAVMGTDTNQADIIVRMVMGDIDHMMGVMAVIVKGVITAKVLGVIVPMKVDTVLEATEATVVGILVIRVGGGDFTDFPSNLHFTTSWGEF
jgi:ABC-type dipeptide/oligopeptide/nickel transport system permease subunit